jgi:dipeptidyl aminopeptidase/acylaminoacyl peptidase
VLVLLATPAAMTGQTKHPVGISDYGKFETLVAQPRAGLSPDGRWLTYGINRANRDNELRITSVTTGESWTTAFGSQPTFSADSKWVVYVVGYSESQEEKLRREKKPIHRKLGTLELATGKMSTVDGIEQFAFNAAGTYLAMKRYAPERKEAPDAAPSAGAEDPPSASTLVVRHLESGRDTTLGNVTDFAWQDKGGLLALAVGTEDKLGNGVQVFDPETGTLRVLDSAPAVYVGLTWRKDESKETNDLAVLRGTTDDLPAYIRNSAVFGVNNMKAPLLVAFGDNDGTVHWHQGVELYNIARRAKKDVVMLVYGGEGHSNRRKPNQLDYERRIVQWFGHYLKGEPAEPWIASGVTYLDRERELNRLKSSTSNKGS